MKHLFFTLAIFTMSLFVVSCGGSSSKDKERIAELEAQLAELQAGSTSDNSMIEYDSSYTSSTSSNTSTRSNKGQSIVGTYEFSDNINTWCLVIERDEDNSDEGTCYIINKSKGGDVKCYGSWYKYSTMKYASLHFSEKKPIVFFPSGEETLRSPYVNTEWIYANSSASEAKNPNLRLPLKKID